MRLSQFPFFAAILLAGHASAATIGIVAPQSGPYAILGNQLRTGAIAALKDTGHTILELNESCNDGSGPTVAEELINAKAQIAIGFLCSESIDGGIELLAANNLPVLTLSSRANGLIEDAQKYNWPLYRMAPAITDEANAVVDAIISRWKGDPIALIDDGTIYSRELVDAIRLRLENFGLKPSFIDTIRPGQENQLALVRRLSRLNINHLFVAADRNDVAIIARDGIDNQTPLNVMSGEAMKAPNNPVPTPLGTLAVIEPDHLNSEKAIPIIGQMQSNGTIVEGYVLPAYSAGQIADTVLKRSEAEQKASSEILTTSSFDTVIGPIRFNEQKGLNENPFRLQQWNGEAFVQPSQP